MRVRQAWPGNIFDFFFPSGWSSRVTITQFFDCANTVLLFESGGSQVGHLLDPILCKGPHVCRAKRARFCHCCFSNYWLEQPNPNSGTHWSRRAKEASAAYSGHREAVGGLLVSFHIGKAPSPTMELLESQVFCWHRLERLSGLSWSS